MRGEPPSQIGDEQGRDDDWLADEGELDWFDAAGEEEPGEWPQGEQTRAGLVRAPARGPARAGPEVERRRRMLFLGALVAGIALLIVVVVLATGGGGGESPTVAATTSQTTQPATTPTAPTTTTTGTSTTATTASLHVTIPEGGHLSAGDSGQEVVTLQKALTELGYDVGTADGDFGQRTADAVIAFQQAHDLNPDGIVGTETAQAMNDALAAAGH